MIESRGPAYIDRVYPHVVCAPAYRPAARGTSVSPFVSVSPCACMYAYPQVGRNTHLAYPTLSADRATGSGSLREKKTVSIGSRVMIGHGSYVGAGATIGNDSMVRGWLPVRFNHTASKGNIVTVRFCRCIYLLDGSQHLAF